jgi:hypothetical protein
MRLTLAAFLTLLATAACAAESPTDGSVGGGSFGMSGSDYFGDLHSRMPFTQEAPPRPIGVADVERARTARRHAQAADRRADARRLARRRHAPHG